MPDTKLSDKIKKNLLDLHHQRYLQYFNTCLIILVTYLVGVTIAFITKQIKIEDINQILAVVIVSLAFIGTLVLLLIYFKTHLTKIPQEIKKLKL